MAELILDFIPNILPSVLAISQNVTSFYRDQQNTITFFMLLVKILVLLVTSIYLLYLFFYKGQTTRVVGIKFSLIQSVLILILGIISLRNMYKNSEKVKSAVKSTSKKLKKLIKK
jgi:hypothetical protein